MVNMMLTRAELEPFIHKVAVVSFRDNTQEIYNIGEVVAVSDSAVVLENLRGQRTVISLEQIVRVKEK